jgi:isocitrate/isopropylmalate dehydrogenase
VRWLGEEDIADGLKKCVEDVTGRRVSAKLGGKCGTKEVTEAVCEEIEKAIGKWLDCTTYYFVVEIVGIG